jgi:two-component system, OmpR family, phosphate regulon sensor histidine kinase PhoR
MNKKAIFLIILLMSVALVGSVGLQIYWISNAVTLNEEQFDKNVFAALRRVAERVEKEEDAKVSKISDFVLRNKTNNGIKLTEDEIIDLGLNPSEVISFDSTYHSTQNVMESEGAFFIYQRAHNMLQMLLSQQLFGTKPIEERINAENLDMTLRQELKNVGLSDLGIQYGVYSFADKDYIIKNGNYVITEKTPTPDAITVQQFDYLSNTRYKVNLFLVQDLQSPGYLSVYFDNKSNYIWSSVWKILLASVIFSGIILFCFSYTLSIIFRQKKLDEIKNDFINNMTHEFKTPIATISLAADSLSSPAMLNNPDKLARFINIIKQENKRLNGQVEKVLQMAIVDREKFKLKIVEVDVHEIIEHACANFSIQIENREGLLEANLDADRSTIEADFTHISNIIHNLMDNANKYSPEKPEITVSTRNISDGIEITVDDKGMGLSPSTRKLIFDKFYRVPTGNVHDVKGFGLGLSYVKTMVTAHKGTIDVKSELGKGSSFIIFLPFKHKADF